MRCSRDDSHGEGPFAFDYVSWLARLRSVAERYVCQYRLPPDLADDLAQEASLRAWSTRTGPLSATHLEMLIDQLARAERTRLRCERGLPEVRCPPNTGVPPLCPKLKGITMLHRNAVNARWLTWRAAVALSPRLLDAERFHLFYLAWIAQWRIGRIQALVRGSSAPALQKRLRRISRAIERDLVVQVAPLLSPRERAWLRSALEDGADCPNETAWSGVAKALGEVIHRFEGGDPLPAPDPRWWA